MIRRYLRFQWENRYTVAVLAGVLLLAGWVAFERLPQSIFPPVRLSQGRGSGAHQ